ARDDDWSEGCNPALIPETGYEHRGGSLAHGISGQGSQRPGLTVDAVRSQASGGRADGEDQLALRVQTEGAGDRFGGHLPDRSQTPGGVVYGETRDAVVSAVADIEELSRRREMNLGAGVPRGKPVGQGRDRLHGGEVAGRAVQAIAGDAAALLV